MASDVRIIYVTFANESEALQISQTLVEEHLVACANILGPVRSIFRWQGKISDETEVAVLMKTTAARSKAAMTRIVKLHSYDTPGIEIWTIADTPKAFADWIKKETS